MSGGGVEDLNTQCLPPMLSCADSTFPALLATYKQCFIMLDLLLSDSGHLLIAAA